MVFGALANFGCVTFLYLFFVKIMYDVRNLGLLQRAFVWFIFVLKKSLSKKDNLINLCLITKPISLIFICYFNFLG